MTGDEVVKVRTRVPRSIILACTTNAIFLFAYAICLLYNLGDPDEVSASPLPILIVYYQATGSKPAANLLASMLVIVFFFALFNMLASVSRLVWVFAKDSGLPFSKQLAYVSRTSSALTYLRCSEERNYGSLLTKASDPSHPPASPPCSYSHSRNRAHPILNLHSIQHSLQRTYLSPSISSASKLCLSYSFHATSQTQRSTSALWSI
jgi:hypothetical protein